MKTEKRYLVPGDYIADPAVHVFDGKLYIYPSHDWESGIAENDNGDHFNMKDYHVYSMDDVMNGEITDHGVVLSTENIPWAGRQLWDCDVAFKDGKYYMYFPLKDQNDIFRIGVAVSDKPYGPFTYQGVILTPVVGWTTHHAIVEFKGKWYLFHHDCVPSEGKTWLRSLKVCELQYDADGKIITIEGLDE